MYKNFTKKKVHIEAQNFNYTNHKKVNVIYDYLILILIVRF